MALAETAKLAVDMSLTGNFKSALAGNERALSSFTSKVDSVAVRGVSGLQTGLGKIETAVGKFGGALGHAKSQIGGLISGPLGLIGLGAGLFTIAGALEHGITKAQEFGDEVYKLKAITGLSAESVSALASGLEHFGISGDTAIRSIGLLEKNVGLLASKKGAIADFEKTFGLAVTDANGKVKDANELILTTADYFNNKAIPAQTKAAAIAKLYGRSWQQLLPALIAGRQGIIDAEVAAKDLGLTLTEANVGALAKFRSATRELGTAVGGLELQIGLALVPALTDLAKVATTFVAQNRDKIVQFFKDAAHFAQELGAVIQNDVVPVFGAIATGWNAIPKEVRDLVIAGLVGNKIIKWTFGFSPITFVAGSIEKGLGAILGQFIGKGVVQPVFVTNPGLGGAPGAAGVPGKLGGLVGTAANLISKVFVVGMVAEVADLIHGAISPGGGLEGRTNSGNLLPGDQLEWPFGPKNTPHVDIGPIKNILGGDSQFIPAPALVALTKPVTTADNRTPGSILDRGGREKGFNELAGKLKDDRVSLGQLLKANAAKIASDQLEAMRSIWSPISRALRTLGHTNDPAKIAAAVKELEQTLVKEGHGNVANTRTAVHELEAQLKRTHDPTLQDALRHAISDLKAKIPGREYAERQIAKADKIFRSTQSTADKIRQLQAIENDLKNHKLPGAIHGLEGKINALKTADVTAQHATANAVKAKKSNLNVTIPVTNTTYVNTRRVLTTAKTLTNFYSFGHGIIGG